MTNALIDSVHCPLEFSYPIDDLLEEAKAKNDVGLLIRSLYSRFQTFWQRQKELNDLLVSFDIKYDFSRCPDFVEATFGQRWYRVEFERSYPRCFMAQREFRITSSNDKDYVSMFLK